MAPVGPAIFIIAPVAGTYCDNAQGAQGARDVNGYRNRTGERGHAIACNRQRPMSQDIWHESKLAQTS